ncbi:MAG: hypothetical protein ACREI9_11450 [Nitrospiraceae bacterium]
MKEYWLDNPSPKGKKSKKRNPSSRAGVSRPYKRITARAGTRRRNAYRKNPVEVKEALLDAMKSVSGFYAVGIVAPRLLATVNLGDSPLISAAGKILVAYFGGTLIESFNSDFGKQFALGGILNAVTSFLDTSGFNLGSYSYDPNQIGYIPGFGWRLPASAEMESLPAVGEYNMDADQGIITKHDDIPDRLQPNRLI